MRISDWSSDVCSSDLARRRVDRRRYVALQHDPLATATDRRLLHVGHGREQGLGVGVVRTLVERLAVRDLDDLAEVHHGDLGAEVPDHSQVVGDEQEGDVELLLQVLQEVDHLRLDRHVEGRRSEEHTSELQSIMSTSLASIFYKK